MRGCFVFLDVFCVFCCTQFERCVVCCHTGQTKEEDRENDAFRILSLSIPFYLRNIPFDVIKVFCRGLLAG